MEAGDVERVPVRPLRPLRHGRRQREDLAHAALLVAGAAQVVVADRRIERHAGQELAGHLEVALPVRLVAPAQHHVAGDDDEVGRLGQQRLDDLAVHGVAAARVAVHGEADHVAGGGRRVKDALRRDIAAGHDPVAYRAAARQPAQLHPVMHGQPAAGGRRRAQVLAPAGRVLHRRARRQVSVERDGRGGRAGPLHDRARARCGRRCAPPARGRAPASARLTTAAPRLPAGSRRASAVRRPG